MKKIRMILHRLGMAYRVLVSYKSILVIVNKDRDTLVVNDGCTSLDFVAAGNAVFDEGKIVMAQEFDADMAELNEKIAFIDANERATLEPFAV